MVVNKRRAKALLAATWAYGQTSYKVGPIGPGQREKVLLALSVNPHVTLRFTSPFPERYWRRTFHEGTELRSSISSTRMLSRSPSR